MRYDRKSKIREDDEEDVSNCRVTVRNREDNRISNRTHYVSFSGDVALEQAVDVLPDG